jgi:hypothetical protein
MRAMSERSRVAIGVALAAAMLAPAARAAEVTVATPCVAEGDAVGLRGSGFTPGARVRLTMERGPGPRTLVDTTEPAADGAGVVAGNYQLENETGWFGAEETRFAMTLRLFESAAVNAATTFTFSRWNVGYTGRLAPGRAVTLSAVGFTQAVGRPLYAHYVRRGRRVRSVRLGVLRGPCGDRRVRLRDAFPFRPVAAGAWAIRVNARRRDPGARDTVVLPARVRRAVRR